MGIRCSIFGCEYEDTTIERDEKRHGDEVILTVREYRQCTRCENTELISENTGITTLADEEREVGEAEPDPTDPSASDPESTERPEVTADSGPNTGTDTGAPTENAAQSGSAELLETTATEDRRPGGLDETATVEDGSSITGATDDVEEEYPEDDAVILDSSGTTGRGARGASTSRYSRGRGGSDRSATSGRGGWPDERTRTSGGRESATSTVTTTESRSEEGFDSGTGTETRTETGIETEGEASTGSGADETDRTPPADPATPGSVRCSTCDYGVSTSRSPHRAGDICPECGRGYLEEL